MIKCEKDSICVICFLLAHTDLVTAWKATKSIQIRVCYFYTWFLIRQYFRLFIHLILYPSYKVYFLNWYYVILESRFKAINREIKWNLTVTIYISDIWKCFQFWARKIEENSQQCAKNRNRWLNSYLPMIVKQQRTWQLKFFGQKEINKMFKRLLYKVLMVYRK